MIGLKYLLVMNNIKHEELAKKLGIKSQRIDIWVRTFNADPIPIIHEKILVNLFNIPFKIIQKELNIEDMLYIYNHNSEHPKMIILRYMLFIYNISNEELADKLDIRKENISKWSHSGAIITEKYGDILFNIFGVSIEYLQKELTREDIFYILNLPNRSKLEEIVIFEQGQRKTRVPSTLPRVHREIVKVENISYETLRKNSEYSQEMGLQYMCRILDISRSKLANALNITSANLNVSMTNGKGMPGIHLDNIASIFNISRDTINTIWTNEDKIKLLELEIKKLKEENN